MFGVAYGEDAIRERKAGSHLTQRSWGLRTGHWFESSSAHKNVLAWSPDRAFFIILSSNNWGALHNQGAIKQFQKPLGFTLFYADECVGPLPEEQLAVLMFDEDYSVWRDAVYTCPDGEYARELDENSISLPVCHLTAFGLFNKPETPLRLYFPMGLK